jgi:3-methyladenine DNA glycosylase AlkD
MNDLITQLQSRLEERANSQTKAWWERYLKQAITFRGVKMADIRAVLHAWIADEQIETRLSTDEQKELALTLLRETVAEDKLAGILFLQEVLLPLNAIQWQADLPRLARLFKEGDIYDWNTCDWFCVKFLGPLIEQAGEACARATAEWRHAENLWQRRASGVAFVNLAKHGDANFEGFTDLLLEICAATIQHPERFAQTGTGWVLRELSLADQERVVNFIEQHIDDFSSEGLRYATEKLPPPIKEALLQQRRKR